MSIATIGTVAHAAGKLDTIGQAHCLLTANHYIGGIVGGPLLIPARLAAQHRSTRADSFALYPKMKITRESASCIAGRV